MKILLADQFSELGGAQRVLLELLPGLQREGWTCVLAFPGHGPLRTRAEALGVRCEEITCGPFGCGSKSLSDMVRFGVQFPGLRGQFRKLIKEIRPDVLYLNAPRLVPAACSLSDLPPTVFHVHSYLKPRSIATFTGRFLRRAHASVIGNCSYVLEPLREFLRDSAVEVIYNGVQDCAPAERRPGSARGIIKRIGIIGRIAPEKGQKVFVEAARRVHAVLPATSFVICGGTQFSGGETYLSEVKDLAAGLPVEFTGWREDVREVLGTLDLLVVASLPQAEATTRVIPEAYSARVPVLASDLPGIREVLQDGENGFVFTPGDPLSLTRRICEILEAPASVDRVTANARLAFEERFSIEVFQRRIISSLDRAGTRALA